MIPCLATAGAILGFAKPSFWQGSAPRYNLVGVNSAVRAGYWRFIEAPGGADKAQR